VRPFDRPRTVALVLGLLLAVGGGALAAFAPEPPVYVPVAPGAAPDVPRLKYLFALPEPGDAPFERPVCVAVGSGRLYVTDSEAGLVRSFSTAGPDAGDIGTDVLGVPAYVAKDPLDGSLLVSDRARRALYRFDTSGELLGEVRPSGEATGTWEPLGVAADGEGAIAVTDASARHRVVVMDEAGEVSLTLGGSGIPAGDVAVSLEFPNTVAFNGDELWVGDSNNRRVLVFDREGGLLRLVRVSGVARGLAFVSDGELTHAAVVAALTSEIVLLDAEGGEAARFGGPGSAPGQLAYPNDVAFEPGTRRLYVADTGNARVQVWEAVAAEKAEADLGTGGRGPSVSAMRMAGLIALAIGALVAAAAVWPYRRSRGTEVAPG
jgi:DNA-binding beta-propeller fold protein YncE